MTVDDASDLGTVVVDVEVLERDLVDFIRVVPKHVAEIAIVETVSAVLFDELFEAVVLLESVHDCVDESVDWVIHELYLFVLDGGKCFNALVDFPKV